jgi:uncharacterized membrane protein
VGDYLTGASGTLQDWSRSKIIDLPWGDFITGIADLNTAIVDKIVELPWGDYITGTA